MVLSVVVPSGRARAAGNCAGSQVFCNGCLVQVIGGQNCIRSCDQNCTSVQIGNNVKSIGTNAFSNCTNLKNVTLPGCVNSVGSCAFNGCSNLSTVTLGANTKKIGDNAFKNCKNLKTINIKSKKLNSNCVSRQRFVENFRSHIILLFRGGDGLLPFLFCFMGNFVLPFTP